MRLTPATARRLGAFLTAVVGAINVASALYPPIPSRMELLRDILPMHFIQGTQSAAVLVGFFLILLADGLRKRRTRAMQITVCLLLTSSVLNLTKGLDFEEAVIAASLAVGLLVTRSAYQVPSGLPAPRRLAQHIATFGLLYYCYVLVGFLVLRHAITPAPTIAGATLEPFRLLGDASAYHYLTAQARWFERSLAFMGGVAVLYALAELLRPLIPRLRPTSSELSRVRSIVKRYGSDTLSYFAFQHGRSYFFDESGDAFLSYRMWRSVAIVGGHAIGPAERVPAVIESFLRFCDANGIEPCFLGIGSADVGTYASLGLRTLKIGEEALIDLPDFESVSLKRKVRRAARHIEDLGFSFASFGRDALPPDLAGQMHEISRQWIVERGGSERGFSMTLGRLPDAGDTDCEVAVALKDGRVWGYLCMVPVYGSSAWSLDAMRRRSDAPNGLMEFLVIRVAEEYRDRGYLTLSLNFATLSNCQNDIDSRALDGTRRFIYQHLSSVYQLKSLEQFNGKFQPRWHSRYLAYRDVLKFPKLALAIAQSEDPIRLPSPAGLFRRLGA